MEIEFSFFSSGYLDVSVPRVPSAWLCIHHAVTEVYSARFPHSEIAGSKDICSSPTLIAAYHVFLRLLVPRHPPYALCNLTTCALKLKAHIALCLFNLNMVGFLEFSSKILKLSFYVCLFAYIFMYDLGCLEFVYRFEIFSDISIYVILDIFNV